MTTNEKGAGRVTRAALKVSANTDSIEASAVAQRESARAIGSHVGNGLRHGREALALLLSRGRCKRARKEIDAAIAAFERAVWTDDYSGAEQ